jgi:hypothetical protein
MAGRPTIYSDALMQKAREYVEGDYDTIYSHSIPSHLGLCEALSITKSTLYKWAGEEGKEAFADILARCNAKQHNILIAKGLSGDFNASIAKLVLGKHGYHDRVESTGADGGPIENKWTVEIVSAKTPAA